MVDGKLVSADVYNKVKYDSMLIRFPKGQKDVITAHAAARGESVNGFIGRAITETMDRDDAQAVQNAAERTGNAGGIPVPDKPQTPSEDAHSGKERAMADDLEAHRIAMEEYAAGQTGPHEAINWD